jgi:hypothetical protein
MGTLRLYLAPIRHTPSLGSMLSLVVQLVTLAGTLVIGSKEYPTRNTWKIFMELVPVVLVAWWTIHPWTRWCRVLLEQYWMFQALAPILAFLHIVSWAMGNGDGSLPTLFRIRTYCRGQ